MKPVLSFIAPLALLAACSVSAAESFEQAKTEFAARDYRAANIAISRALQAEPDNAQFLELAAKAQLAVGDGTMAEASLQRLASLGHQHPEWATLMAEALLLQAKPTQALELLSNQARASAGEVHRLKAWAQLQLSEPKAALAEFQAGVAADRTNARLFADYARFQLMIGDVMGARESADLAMKLSPKAATSMIAAGDVAVSQGDAQRALRVYGDASKLYPGNVAALAGEAAVLGDLGRLEDMDRKLGEVLAIDPSNPVAMVLKARLASKHGKWSDVRDILQAGWNRIEQRPDAILLMAEAQLKLGQQQQALAAIEGFRARFPNNRMAIGLHAAALFATGDAGASADVLRPIVTRLDASPEELELMAKISAAIGSPDAAIFAQRAKFPSAGHLAVKLAEGDAALKSGNWTRAIATYNDLNKLTGGKNPVVLNNLAWANHQVGNIEIAIDFAAKAYAIDPKNPSVLDTYGWLLLSSGKDKAKGSELVRRAAQLAPNNPNIANHLKQAS